jgi:Zn-dependent protease with chaperone function
MDFFGSQDAARQNTGRLVALFGLAVVSLILSVYVVIALAFGFAGDGSTGFWHPDLFVAVVVSTAGVVTCGSLYKIAQLRGGGRVVAESLGGRLVRSDSQDPNERKILNVVEEMAIASGTAVPSVYLLERETAINAFAAGYTPDDAVIGVTRGTIEQLSRSELQGVIAHEFSHILNGDMRLNIRLIGILNGILVIGLIGYFILRSMAFGPRVQRRGKDSGGAVAILAVGAGLAVVGFVGTLCGNLIKSAVSRQREYLADASAVQFTRNPGAVAGALKRIGGFTPGSGIRSPGAAEASHMFFARAVTSGLQSMFSTHPPLETRIRRIEPRWDGNYLTPRAIERPEKPAGAGRERIDLAGVITGAAILAGAESAGETAASPENTAVAQIGNPTTAHVEYAASLVTSIPDAALSAAREPYGARAVVYALLLDSTPEVRRPQMARLETHADAAVVRLVDQLLEPMSALRSEARLPLVDIAVAALGELTASQYTMFRRNVMALARADDELNLFEWVLSRVILRHLDPKFSEATPVRTRYYSLERLGGPCSTLLSALAHRGHDTEEEARRAFAQGAARLGIPALELLGAGHATLDRLDDALRVLDTVAFRLKRNLLEACAVTVSTDGRVRVVEGELLRGIADAVGCPMPPLLPGQPLA